MNMYYESVKTVIKIITFAFVLRKYNQLFITILCGENHVFVIAPVADAVSCVVWCERVNIIRKRQQM